MRSYIVHFTNGEIRTFNRIDRIAMDDRSNELVLISNDPGFSCTIPRERVQYYQPAKEVPTMNPKPR